MKYRILTIGDPHIKSSNINTIRKLKEKLIDLIKDQRPDGVVILGDLHDSHSRVDVYTWIEENNFIRDIAAAAESSGGWLKYVVGNHDIPSNNIFLEKIHPFVTLSDTVIVDYPQAVKTPAGTFAFVPYVPNGRFKEALGLLPEKGPYRAIFCHQEFKNADLGSSIISKNGDEWPADGDMIISGHIHKKQRINEIIHYVGSPYHVNFGEHESKSVSLFEFSCENNFYEEGIFDLELPRKITHSTDVAGLSGLKVYDNDENRLIITDTSINIANFKSTEEYQDLKKKAKVIFKPSDKVFIKRNVEKKTFLDIMRDLVEKEGNSEISNIFGEVVNVSVNN